METDVKDLNTNGVDPVEDDLHTELVRMFDQSEQSFLDYHYKAERDRDYVDGKQWTDEERAKIVERGQAPIVINRIKPKIDFLLGAERERRTDIKGFPRTPVHQYDSDAATEALRYIGDSSNFDNIRSKVFENGVVEGYGCVQVRKKGDKIIIEYIPWDRSFYDPYARDDDLGDRNYAGYAIWMDFDDAVTKYPDYKEQLENSIREGQSAMSETYSDKPISRHVDPERKRLRIIEIYYNREGKIYRSVYCHACILEKEKRTAYRDEDGNDLDPYEFFLCYIDREGNPYGVVRNLIDIQDEINKRRSKALHLLSVRQVKYEKGAVDDTKEMRNQLARPDGAVEVNDMDGFEVMQTGDMAQAQFTLLQEAKSEIDAVGANAAMSGKDERDLSGRAMQARAQSGYIEVAPLYDNLRMFQTRVYRKVWYCVRKFWTAEKWLRVTDNEENMKWVALNVPDPETGQIVNPVSEMDVDIILDEAPDSVSLQQEEFHDLSAMAKAGVPIPPDAIIEASSIRGKEKILKKMRGEFEDEEQKAAYQEQQQIQNRQVMADIMEKEARARDLMAKAEERMANVRIKVATLEQKGILGLAEITKDLQLAEHSITKDLEIADLGATKDLMTQRGRLDG